MAERLINVYSVFCDFLFRVYGLDILGVRAWKVVPVEHYSVILPRLVP